MFFINTSGRRITKTFKCMVHFTSLCNYKYYDEILKWSWKTITIKLFFQLLKLTKSYIELWFMKLFWLTPSLIIVLEVEKNALGEHESSFQFSDCWWCFSMEKICWLWLSPGFIFFFFNFPFLMDCRFFLPELRVPISMYLCTWCVIVY